MATESVQIVMGMVVIISEITIMYVVCAMEQDAALGVEVGGNKWKHVPKLSIIKRMDNRKSLNIGASY